MQINVLITSASRKVSLVKSFKKAVNSTGKGNVVAVDTNPQSAALFYADKCYLVPKDDDPDFISTILKLCKKEKINLIIPTRDEELLIFAKSKKLFEEIGTKVMISETETVEICLDKGKFVNFCLKNNISVPKTYDINSIVETDFPLFIRDRFGKGSKKAFIVNNKNSLKFYLKIGRAHV